MTAPVLSPLGTYTDVTGVVDGTAAGEIVALIDVLLSFIPDTTHENAQDSPPEGAAPEFDRWPPALAALMRAEITAFAAAIAAAPTA